METSAIGYSRVREIFRATLLLFVKDCHNYGTHSLRKGGASAASAAGISGKLLDKLREIQEQLHKHMRSF